MITLVKTVQKRSAHLLVQRMVDLFVTNRRGSASVKVSGLVIHAKSKCALESLNVVDQSKEFVILINDNVSALDGSVVQIALANAASRHVLQLANVAKKANVYAKKATLDTRARRENVQTIALDPTRGRVIMELECARAKLHNVARIVGWQYALEKFIMEHTNWPNVLVMADVTLRLESVGVSSGLREKIAVSRNALRKRAVATESVTTRSESAIVEFHTRVQYAISRSVRPTALGTASAILSVASVPVKTVG